MFQKQSAAILLLCASMAVYAAGPGGPDSRGGDRPGSKRSAPSSNGGNSAVKEHSDEVGMFGIGASIGSLFYAGGLDIPLQGIPGLRVHIRPIQNAEITLAAGYGSATLEGSPDDDEYSVLELTAMPKYILREGSMEMQIGAIVGYASYSEDNAEADQEFSAWQLGAVLGGEYFLSRYFSIGSEIQAVYQTGSVDPDVGASQDVSGFSTGAAVTFNSYF